MRFLFISTLAILLVALLFTLGCDESDDTLSPPPTRLVVSSDSLSFAADDDGIDTLFISADGSDVIHWYLDTAANWMAAYPDTGSVSGSETDTVIVSVFRNGVPTGTYDDDLIATTEEGDIVFVNVQMEVQLPGPFQLLDLEGVILYEGLNAYYGPYGLSYDTVPSITLDLIQWLGDYEFEVLLLEEADYTAYTAGEPFDAYFSFNTDTVGLHEITADTAIPAESTIYIILDNTDLGYFPTDGGDSDVAVFDFQLDMTPVE